MAGYAAAATIVLVAVTMPAGVAASASRPPAYCPLPASAASSSWGFHVGAPITAASGSYAHGNGTVSGQTATGRICQVDRVAASAIDRQIQLTAAHGGANLQRGITVGGVRGAELQLPVRVTSSTDPRCLVGTHGTLTLFSSYNGTHVDTATFAFPKACRTHDHSYRGSEVVVALYR